MTCARSNTHIVKISSDKVFFNRLKTIGVKGVALQWIASFNETFQVVPIKDTSYDGLTLQYQSKVFFSNQYRCAAGFKPRTVFFLL